MSSVMSKRTSSLLVLILLVTPLLSAQSVRDHTRQSGPDRFRARYRMGDKHPGTSVSESQATELTLTLNEVTVRPIQVWVRTAGRIDKANKVLTAFVWAPDSDLIKVGQRVRTFAPESKSSMFQAWVTKTVPQNGGSMVEVTLSGVGRSTDSNYVMEIVTERGEYLSIPNEAIIEEGTHQVVYVQGGEGQYLPRQIQTGIQGELYTEVRNGLKPGEQVVTFGSFFIDSEYKLKSAATDAQ
jgi:multidrug efflux pump subunit AcrA (membrane-fusion protein)